MVFYKVISLVAFAAGKNKDYASHWLKRQLQHKVNSKPFARLLTPERLFPGRGSHSVYIVDRDVAEKVVTLLPKEWKRPSELLDKYFHATEAQRAALLLDAYDETNPPPVCTQRAKSPNSRGYLFAAHSVGNGTKLSGVVGNKLRLLKTVEGMGATVRNSYALLGDVKCKDVPAVKAFVHKLLEKHRVGDRSKELFEAPEAEVRRVFKALHLLRRRALAASKKEATSV